YVFRSTPSATVGYDWIRTRTRRCGVFVDYQSVKDVYANHRALTFPTNQLVGAAAYVSGMPFQRIHTRYINYLAPVTVYASCEQREIWQTAHVRQGNLLPGIYLSRPPQSSKDVATFASVILAMVSAEPFLVRSQEIDPT